MIRVLIVDDSELLRRTMTLVLGRDERIEVAGEADDGFSAVEAAAALQPDAVLMDLSMPRHDGVSAIRELRGRMADIRIVAFSGYSDEHLAAEALAAGADRYVSKGEPAAAVISALLGEEQ